MVTGLGRAGRAREAAAWLFQMEEVLGCSGIFSTSRFMIFHDVHCG